MFRRNNLGSHQVHQNWPPLRHTFFGLSRSVSHRVSCVPVQAHPLSPQSPVLSSHNTASPSTMMLLSILLRKTRPMCFQCANRQSNLIQFCHHLCHHYFCSRHRYSNQHHMARKAGRSQRKVFQSPSQLSCSSMCLSPSCATARARIGSLYIFHRFSGASW